VEPYQKLEREFGNWAGFPQQNMVACSSGTAALHLALAALGLPKRSRVLVPEFTMIACARAVTLAGMEPVFIDCDDRLLLDIERTEFAARYHPNVQAIMAVHIYGRQCDMDRIAQIQSRLGTYVVEDLAEAHGIPVHPTTDAACWSFYRNKIIAGEEGGMVAFRLAIHAEVARSLRCMGFDKRHDFRHVPGGMNYRLANLLAEPILQSLSQVENNLNHRRDIEATYDAATPAAWRMPRRDVVWVYDLRLPGASAADQNRAISALQAEGIAARHGFKPMTSQSEYKQKNYQCLRAYRYSQEVLYLPVVPQIDQAVALRIVGRFFAPASADQGHGNLTCPRALWEPGRGSPSVG